MASKDTDTDYLKRGDANAAKKKRLLKTAYSNPSKIFIHSAKHL
jgi:hypothetical protein